MPDEPIVWRGERDFDWSNVPQYDKLKVRSFDIEPTAEVEEVDGLNGTAAEGYHNPGVTVSIEATMRSGFVLPKPGDLFLYDGILYTVKSAKKKGELKKTTSISITVGRKNSIDLSQEPDAPGN